MKNSKKFLLLLIFICISLLLFFMIQIYAKYKTSTEGSTSFAIANWNILVNELSIKNNSDFSNSIVPVFIENEHISNNIIAPTSEGYFDLNLDFSNVDVSFKYEISAKAAENSSVKDLVSTGYCIDDGEKINFETYNSPISETIPLSATNKTRKIRIYILWNDDESTQTMDNSADTLSTLDGVPALFDVNISFTQVTDIPLDDPSIS